MVDLPMTPVCLSSIRFVLPYARQFLPDSRQPTLHPRNGSGHCRSRLELERSYCAVRLTYVEQKPIGKPLAQALGIGIGVGSGVGSGIGAALGITMHNIGLGIGIGAAVGISLGAAIGFAIFSLTTTKRS